MRCYRTRALEAAYPGAVHGVVYSAEFFDDSVDHLLNGGLVCDVHFDDDNLILAVGGILTLQSCILSALLIQVSKGHAFDACFCEGKRCLFANASCCL